MQESTTVPRSDLKPRVISGIVLAILAAAALYVGGAVLVVAMAVVTAGMVWEALAMTGAGDRYRARIACGLAALMVLCLFPDAIPVSTAAIIAVALGIGVLILTGTGAPRGHRVRASLAVAAICIGGSELVWSALYAPGPISPIVLVVPAVIGTDVGAYFVGRALGGPKLAPRISPNKTWSGAVGGAVAAVLLGGAVLAGFAGPNAISVWTLAALAGLSICAQIGDLAESALKRSAGCKDSGTLIPGHGGLLDRFDGFLGAAVLGLGPWLVLKAAGV